MSEDVNEVEVFRNQMEKKWCVFDGDEVHYYKDKSEALKTARELAKEQIPSDVVVGGPDAEVLSSYRN